MAIPGSGDTGESYLNPNSPYGNEYDQTLDRLRNSIIRENVDFYTNLSFPSDLSRVNISTSEIRDFMEIEILKVVGRGFEEFFDTKLERDITAIGLASSFVTSVGAGASSVTRRDKTKVTDVADIFDRLKSSVQETLDTVGISQFATDKTRMRDQILNTVTKIWIYEPAALNYDYGLKYSDTDLTTAKRIGDTISSITDTGSIPGQIVKQGLTNLVSTVIEGMAKVGANGYDVKSIIGNGDLNMKKYIEYKSRAVPTPLLEYLFEGIHRRKFTFSWKLYPKNELDVYNAFNIIRELKKNSHPTRMGDYYLKYPNLFKIRHLFVNTANEISENYYLGRIKPCVLESLTVNYTDSNGFIVLDKEFDVTSPETNDNQSTNNVFGKGKAPVGISIQANFVELELLLGEDFDIKRPGDSNPFGGGGY